MPRSLSLPKLRRHRPSGQGSVRLGGKDYYLGKWPADQDDPPATVLARYNQKLAEWLANGRRSLAVTTSPAPGGPTVSEVILPYLDHVENYYRHPDGRPTSEVGVIKAVLRRLRALFGPTPAAEFDNLALEKLRARMIDEGLARTRINKDVCRVRALFKWAAGRKLVPVAVYQSLLLVAGLRAGRSGAKETAPVRPVPAAHVEAVLPHVSAEIRAMVELQRLTGMRPGEVCRLRAIDLDVAGRIWLYRPAHHKTAWRGRSRVVPIGPRAQSVLRPFLVPNTQAYLFSPARAEEEWRAAKRAARKTKVYPSEVGRRRKRRVRGPRRRPGERYATRQYEQAIARACDRAFPPPGDLARRKVPGRRGQTRWETPAEWQARLGPEGWAQVEAWRREHTWSPNQLRHSFATEVRKRFGLEAAQVMLGHAHADVTQVYAERDLALAVRVAGEVG